MIKLFALLIFSSILVSCGSSPARSVASIQPAEHVDHYRGLSSIEDPDQLGEDVNYKDEEEE